MCFFVILHEVIDLDINLFSCSYIAGPKYIRWYDGVTKIVKANHPNIKFIGNCHAWQGTADNCSIWRQFLNRSNHAPGTPWPIDAVSFHGCE